MRASLTTRLFFALLLACACGMVFQALAMRASFHSGLLGYLERDAAKSLAMMQPELENRFAEVGSWRFLQQEQAWSDLVTMRIQDNGLSIENADELGALVRIGLIDQDDRFVAGNLRARTSPISVPLTHKGQLVGRLAIVPLADAMAAGLQEFMSQQWKRWWLYLALSLSAVAVATHLLIKPIKARTRALADATRMMAQGVYATRVDTGQRDEFGELARDFNRMAQSLQLSERSRRTLLADLSHELKTPLAVIQAEVESIQDGVRRSQSDSLGNIALQVASLDKAIDDLCDVAQTDIGAHAYRFELLDVGDLLTDAISEYRSAFDERGLTLSYAPVDERLPISGDPTRLAQMLGHILDNALRYTDAPGRVDVRCVRALGAVIIVIEDDPPGLRTEQFERVFERFYRGENARSRVGGGCGLGLSICKNIVEAHGGRISAAKSFTGGVRISVALPSEGA